MRQCIVPILVPLFLILGCETVDNESVAADSLWGEAGAAAYPRAASRMASSGTPATALEARDKEALRAVFPDLVDYVQIHWNSPPLDEIVASEYGVTVGTGDTEGQAFGYDIYIRGPRANWLDRDRLHILLHELTHTRQFVRMGSDLEVFGYEYFKSYYSAGQQYELNPLEQEAIQLADREIEQALIRFQTP